MENEGKINAVGQKEEEDEKTVPYSYYTSFTFLKALIEMPGSMAYNAGMGINKVFKL